MFNLSDIQRLGSCWYHLSTNVEQWMLLQWASQSWHWANWRCDTLDIKTDLWHLILLGRISDHEVILTHVYSWGWDHFLTGNKTCLIGKMSTINASSRKVENKKLADYHRNCKIQHSHVSNQNSKSKLPKLGGGWVHVGFTMANMANELSSSHRNCTESNLT